VSSKLRASALERNEWLENEEKLKGEMPLDILIHENEARKWPSARWGVFVVVSDASLVQARVRSLAGAHDHEHDPPTSLVRGGTERPCISYGNILKASASCANCQTSTRKSSLKSIWEDAC
jgi:hypothetical protein